MYQFIVLGLGFLLVFGGGYLIKHTDKEGVIAQTVTATSTEPSDYAGTYLCDTDSKCDNPRTLVLSSDGTLSLTTSFDQGVETNVETGTWKKEAKGITLTIINSSTTTYGVPLSIHLYPPAPDSLVTSAAATNYPGWGNYIFRKQIQNQE